MLGRSASVLVLLVFTAGCGGTVAAGTGPSQGASAGPAAAPNATTGARGSRAALLARCPALAPSWFDGQASSADVRGQVQQRRQLGLRSDPGFVRQLQEEAAAGSPEVNASYGPVLTQQEQRVLARRQQAVSRAEQVARRYLRQLPAGQAGDLRTGNDQKSIVVQVTRNGTNARAALQALVGTDVKVDIETVRYPLVELQRLAQRIQHLPHLHWSSIAAGSGDDRVEVQVPNQVDQARHLIATIADSCEFTVRQGVVTPADGTAATATAHPTSTP